MYRTKEMRKSAIVLIALITFTSTIFGGKNTVPAQAEVVPVSMWDANPIYIGLGAMMTSISRDPCPCKPNGPDMQDHRTGVILRIGADYNQFIGIEGRYIKNLENNVFSEIEHYGLFIKPQYHITDQINVYGLIGYGKTKVNYTNGILNCEYTTNSISYGLGFEYDFGRSLSLGAYDRAFDEQGNQESGWGLWVDIQHILTDASPVHTNLNIITAGISYDF